jgi:serine/threonine protein kinase
MSSTTPRLDSDNPSVLPLGTRLGEFEVRGVLGVGGFGIVYLAFDHALEREVAVKEYMPASLAGRTETMHVSLRSQSDADTFALGLRSFVNEAKLLARFDHPSLLKVHRYWEANGTAYMAMPVMRGRTLKEVRAEMGPPPDEAWLRAMLTPLLSAIDKLHAEGVYHRDIAPDNIQIGPDGVPVLLDFGAARRVISDKSQTLTAILKPAYAPIEQYAEAGSVKQGPWTDLYALGATLHYLLLNRPPPPATTRAIHDEASGLSTELCPGCSEDFLRTIDWMLAPRPADRPQNVAALREVLDGHQSPPRRRADAAPQASQWDRTVIVGASTKATTVPPSAVDLAFDDPDGTRIVPMAPTASTAARAAASDATVYEPPQHTAPPSASRVVPAPRAAAPAPEPPPPAADFAAPPVAAALGQPTPAAAPGGRRWLPVALGGALVAVAAVAFALWPRGAAEPLPEAAAPASAAAMAEPASAAAPAAVAEPASAAVAESAVATVVVPAAPAARPPAVAAEVPAANTRPAAPAAKPPAATRPANNGPVVASVPAAPAPTPEPARVPAQAAVQPAAPTASVAPAPEPAKPVAEAGPEALCQGRNALSYFVCMERECLRSKFQSHNDCVKWRKEASRREGN